MGTLGELALSVSRARSRKKQEGGFDAKKCPNIIEFVEAPWGLNRKPYPVQKVILKAFYGIALDRVKKNVLITDWRRQDVMWVTEAEYLEYLYSKGRSNIREVVPGVSRKEMVLAIGRRSGKCITGESLVLTEQGIYKIADLLPNADLAEDNSTPLQVQVAQEGNHRAATSHFFNGGVKAVREITTRYGYRLGGTDNHRVKILFPDGIVRWKYLADIREGDVVAIHRKTDLWATDFVDCRPYHEEDCRSYHEAFEGSKVVLPDYLNEQWALLFGCLMGGDNSHQQSHAVTEHMPSTWCLALGPLGQKDIGSNRVRGFFYSLGWKSYLAWDKQEVPWSILRSPKVVVISFLCGLFETGGGIRSGKIFFSSSSQLLVEQVQLLLLNLGIVSKVTCKIIQSEKFWEISISDTPSRWLFSQKIGFCSRERKELLQRSFKILCTSRDVDTIPFQRSKVSNFLESISKKDSYQKWAAPTLKLVLGRLSKATSWEKVTYSGLRLTVKVAQEVGAQDQDTLEHFKDLLDANYFFDPVRSITEKVEQVWDLTVPEGHSFVANGMVNHNTECAAWICAYEIYCLLLKQNPQRYYGISQGDEIKLCAVATSRDQASELYAKAKHYFLECSRFDPYRSNMTTTYTRFQTQQDIESFGRYGSQDMAQSSIKATFYSCIAKGLRGAGNLVIVLDEIAHFTNSGQSSAKDVYTAVTPSIAAFSPKDPENNMQAIGPSDGRIVLISSPLGKEGFFYEKFCQGFKRPERMLCIQAPSWEVNPTLSADNLESFYLDDPSNFFTEFGADFSDQSRNWIEVREDLLKCVDRTLIRARRNTSRIPHFLGLDIGVTKGGDGTAVAIGHINRSQKIVLDYMELIRAGEGKYAEMERLDFEEIADWIVGLSRQFHIAEGVMDRWAGLPMEQYLHKKGLGKRIQSQLFTPKETTFMFKTFKDMMWDDRLRLYNWKESGQGGGLLLDPEVELCGYLEELLSLREQKMSRHISKVEAPRSGGQHDDQSDALIRMVWLASQRLGNPKFVTGGVAGTTAGVRASYTGVNRPQLTSRRQSQLGGSHPSRQLPSRSGNKGY